MQQMRGSKPSVRGPVNHRLNVLKVCYRQAARQQPKQPADGKENIKVIVRVRPLLGREAGQGSCVEVLQDRHHLRINSGSGCLHTLDSTNRWVAVAGPIVNTMAFDVCADLGVSQEQVGVNADCREG